MERERLLNVKICDRITDRIIDIFCEENLSLHEREIIVAMLLSSNEYDSKEIDKQVDSEEKAKKKKKKLKAKKKKK